MSYSYPFFNASEQLKTAVWRKASPIVGFDSSIWRHDACGHVIRYADHGDTRSRFGWEIDHIYPVSLGGGHSPVSLGGGHSLDNLQPLYWENNRRKGDTYPWRCENAA